MKPKNLFPTLFVATAIVIGGSFAAAATEPPLGAINSKATADVSSAVKAAISAAVGRTSPGITVTDRNGVISLGGWAVDGLDLRRAMNAALRVPGVRRVFNDGVKLLSTGAST